MEPVAGKRRRAQDSVEPSQGSVPRFALVSCFDKRDEMIEVDTSVLEPFHCRLYGVIKHDAPEFDMAGRPFWRSRMTRAMLQTFLRSLEHGELSLSKTVSVAEAMTTFEYENVTIGVPADRRAEIAGLPKPSPGIAFPKRNDRVSDLVLRTCELVAHALLRWPRLETNLDAVLTGYASSCTCTATRAWIRFTRKPHIVEDSRDNAFALCSKWPPWLEALLRAFGHVNEKLVRDKVVGERDRSAAAFDALCGAVEADQLGWLMSTPFDWPRHTMDRAARKSLVNAERFANEIRETVLMQTVRPSGANPKLPEQLHYARACMSLAESMVLDAPNLSSMFAGLCCDDQGKSPERLQLQRSLGQRGIKIVRWAEDDRSAKPLIFPPNWKDASNPGSLSCGVLLEFTAR